MNWKLILSLSLFGIVMAFATVFGFVTKAEPAAWLLIFILYAVVIAKNAPGNYFLHGFLVSVVNGIWIGCIHAAFFSTYMANNPEMAGAYEKMPHFAPMPFMMMVMGPVFGAVFGLINGLFAFTASKLLKKKTSVSL